MNNRNIMEEKWLSLKEAVTERGADGEAVVSAMKKLYSLYSTDLLVWLGKLFDISLGGFYYSSAAKDSDGYLPDIESTYQAIVLLKTSGVVTSYEQVPEKVRRKIASFICSLEEPESGYFYHPQWSKSLTNATIKRKSGDLMRANALSSWLNFELPYISASKKLNLGTESSEKDSNDIFSSKEKYREFLESLDFGENILSSVHTVSIQGDLIKSAGFEDVALKFFEELLNGKNGLCKGEIDVKTIFAFYSISYMYKGIFKTVMPGCRLIAERILSDYLSPDADFDSLTVSHVRNRWDTIDNIIYILNNYGDKEDRNYSKELSSRLLSQAPSVICATAERLEKFKKSTGSFTWLEKRSPTVSSGMVVTPQNSNDGDINATFLAIGMISSIYGALGLPDYEVALFSFEDLKKFEDSIDLS